MSIRQYLQRNSAITTGITLVVIVGALIAIVLHFANARSPGAPAKEAYFSTDDGATWFADDMQKVPPFMSGGKEAVLARVFRCPGGKPFVAYLERFTPEGKKAVEEAVAKSKTEQFSPPPEVVKSGMRARYGEIKKPGDSRWVNEVRDSAAYSAIVRFTCPDGSVDDLETVMP